MNIIQRPADPSNYRKGRTHAIDQITFHHIVGNAPGGTDHFTRPNQYVSSTYAIAADGTIYQYVQEGDTPWTDANADSNSRAITIEHAGPPYAEAMYKASIELCRDIRSRYNITRFKRHRDVSDTPTACPGELNVERIVKESEEAPEMKWNNGQTYNLLYHSISPAVAEEARKANFVGYFGLQGNGEWDMDKALDAIITSLQYGLMVQKAQAGKDVKLYEGPPLYVKD